MINVKWMTKFEAEKLDIPNDGDMYKKEITRSILKNEYIFSGEAHIFGRGIPVICKHGVPIAKWITLPDSWARFMYEIWNPTTKEELRSLDFRTKASMPKCLKINYPKE